VDILLQSVDRLHDIATHADDDSWIQQQQATLDELIDTIGALVQTTATTAPPENSGTDQPEPATTSKEAPAPAPESPPMDPAMMELFRAEANSQLGTLSAELLALEQNPSDSARLEALMRAAHSVKGAARMVNIEPVVRLAHVMEDGFVAAQNGKLTLDSAQIDLLLKTTDLLLGIACEPDLAAWERNNRQTVDDHERWLQTIPAGEGLPDEARSGAAAGEQQPETGRANDEPTTPLPAASAPHTDNAIRVSAESLNRLMGLAGEVQVEARWLRPFADKLLKLKYRQTEFIGLLDRLRDRLADTTVDEHVLELLSELIQRSGQGRQLLAERLDELEEFDRRSHNLASRLNREVIASRILPFADGVHGFQRMVRDISRQLGKRVRLDIQGLHTQVDRDILEKLEAPLNHLIRNALDHGIESPADRAAAGKPEPAVIRLEALHSSGMLSIIVEDDGRGMELDKLRDKIVRKKLVTPDMARDLSEAELMDFIFLPGFSTRDEVSEISGLGVGLDVVHSVVQEMHGIVHAISNPGLGMRFHLQLPLTLSVMRSLMVKIAS